MGISTRFPTRGGRGHPAVIFTALGGWGERPELSLSRVPTDDVGTVATTPRPIEVFVHGHATPHEVAAQGARRDLEAAMADLHRVVIPDHAVVVNRKDPVKIGRAGHERRAVMRAFETAEAKVVPETNGASTPFWSPDGRQVGFFSEGKLRRVALAGGSPVILADGSCCATWSRDGEILFTYFGPNTFRSVIMRVSSDGGVASQVLSPDRARGEIGHRWPVFMPDSRHFLYFVNSTGANVQGIYIASLGSAQSTRVMPAVANIAFVPPDLLVFRPGGRLLVQALDWKQSRVGGEAVQLSDSVGARGISGSELDAFFGAVRGSLAFMPGTARPGVLEWLDRKGNRVAEVGEPSDCYSAAAGGCSAVLCGL